MKVIKKKKNIYKKNMINKKFKLRKLRINFKN